MMGLTLYGEHLKDPKEKEVHEISLVAYVTIRREGAAKITAKDILARIETVKYIMQAMGLDTKPIVIRMLGDIVGEGKPSQDPSFMVSLG